jgi:hypothetical protein
MFFVTKNLNNHYSQTKIMILGVGYTVMEGSVITLSISPSLQREREREREREKERESNR